MRRLDSEGGRTNAPTTRGLPQTGWPEEISNAITRLLELDLTALRRSRAERFFLENMEAAMALPALSLVLGGAASGKSAYAEALVRATPGSRVYIATAQGFDEEMRAKIAGHKAARAGDGWRTVEASLDLAGALTGIGAADVVLLDCATLWLSNVMLAGRDWQDETTALIAALAACPAPVVVVSNETGQGIVPENRLARRFRAAQGGLNQQLAAKAGFVAMVMAGLPMVLKGAAP
jgi:adenosylcobinamide kinase / adenosylcobinamide-phosphate guanylyltransferase